MIKRGFEARRDINVVTQVSQTIEHALHGVTLRVTDQVSLLDARGAGYDDQQLRGSALSKEHKEGCPLHVTFNHSPNEL